MQRRGFRRIQSIVKQLVTDKNYILFHLTLIMPLSCHMVQPYWCEKASYPITRQQLGISRPRYRVKTKK